MEERFRRERVDRSSVVEVFSRRAPTIEMPNASAQ